MDDEQYELEQREMCGHTYINSLSGRCSVCDVKIHDVYD